ncbi:unnamed protein product [Rhizoctonia solani]|nr:unnamed protein product [Rhizoctonia solani]CAE6540638.1 unnamed protein product [Rhizoctonia solani]
MTSTSHTVSKPEASHYYFGIRGLGHLGPKLIYRTSKDVFTPPSWEFSRVMQLLPVYHHDKLGQDNLWATIRDEVVKLLDEREIEFTSVDLARFRWEEEEEGRKSKTFTSRVTIWVGVLPDSLTGDLACESSKDILQLLNMHDIQDIDVAYRESEAKLFSGPKLLAPVDHFDPLKYVIDPLTTALGLPIAGLKTPYTQGTLGFYFRVGDDLYGVTARHVLFPEGQANSQYDYNSARPKKEVVLMGDKAFTDFLTSIQARIDHLNFNVTFYEKQIAAYTMKTQAGNQQAASYLATTQAEMDKKKAAIEALKTFFVRIKKEWSGLNNRIIGYVVWAPPIVARAPPHGYTKDVCVIRLDEGKFLPNFRGNVVDLGPEIEAGDFMRRMYPRSNARSKFDYPWDRLFTLRSILSAAKWHEPNSQDHKGDPARFVIKRGLATGTTIGCLTGFESHKRLYFLSGKLDSVEVAIYPYNNDSRLFSDNVESVPFSKGGDSGALIAGPLAEFGALLTGGTGSTDSFDITYGTPMFWLWNDVIQPQYPGANLYFDIPKY